MKAIYDITAGSRLEIDQQLTYQEQTTQQWEIEMNRHANQYDYELLVKLVKTPETTAWETKPLHDLMRILLQPTAMLHLIIQKDGRFKEIINQSEIISSWESCKLEITDKYGSGDQIVQLIDQLDDSYRMYAREIRRSAFFLLLFMSWQRTELIFHTSSVINPKDNVSVKINVARQDANDGQMQYRYTGIGKLEKYDATRKLYDAQIKPVAKAPFDYSYQLDSLLTFEGKGFCKHAGMQITEAAGKGYIYHLDIDFNLISKES